MTLLLAGTSRGGFHDHTRTGHRLGSWLFHRSVLLQVWGFLRLRELKVHRKKQLTGEIAQRDGQDLGHPVDLAEPKELQAFVRWAVGKHARRDTLEVDLGTKCRIQRGPKVPAWIGPATNSQNSGKGAKRARSGW